MSRLVTFGDSYTFGDALPDTWPAGTIPAVPSKYAWPALVADNLDYRLLNLAKPGSSNLEILWAILNTSFQDDDLVIVAWTLHHDRIHFFEFVNNNTTNIIPIADPRHQHIVLSLSDLATGKKSIFSKHSSYDTIMKNYLLMQHGSLYLKNKKLRSYNVNLNCFNKTSIKIENELKIVPWARDFGLDNMHPGVKSHEFLSNIIYNEVKT